MLSRLAYFLTLRYAWTRVNGGIVDVVVDCGLWIVDCGCWVVIDDDTVYILKWFMGYSFNFIIYGWKII